MITVRENVPLKDYTTFRTGGRARYFAEVTSVDELVEALKFADQKAIRFAVLGGGSNVLVCDQDLSMLVIAMRIEGADFVASAAEATVRVGAGLGWDRLVELSVDKNLSGIESLSLIPGSVGGAVVGNIGAYGSEIGETVEHVDALDIRTRTIRRFMKDECAFAYRHSFFKTEEGRNFIVTSVCLALKTSKVIEPRYKDVSNYLRSHSVFEPTAHDVRNAVIDIRTHKLPDVKMLGTAGSFFKNPIVTVEEYDRLASLFPALPKYDVDPGRVKISAAWMLDNLCKFRGYREGDVGVYQNQALVIVNFGGASSAEVKALAHKMAACVKEKTGISLEWEVEWIG